MSVVFDILTKGVKILDVPKEQKKQDNVEDEGMQLSPDEIREKYRIVVSGTDIPNPFNRFEELFSRYFVPGFMQELLLGSQFRNPTPIQKQAIPVLLYGRDVIGCSETGSGKTLAFIVPVLSILKKHKKRGFRALVITPTRELARQTEGEFVKVAGSITVCLLNKYTVSSLGSDKSHTYDILISTPKRLLIMFKRGIVNLSKLKVIIMDEGDRLFDNISRNQMENILQVCPEKAIRGVFSATLSEHTEEVTENYLRNPIKVVVNRRNNITSLITQKFVFAGLEKDKPSTLLDIMRGNIKLPALIFANSSDRVDYLFSLLISENLKVDAIHTGKTDAERSVVVRNFRLGKVWVLVTTEVLSRGMDFKGVNTVINYDVPPSSSSYIHRIGRTGRNGREGFSVTIFTHKDVSHLKSIAKTIEESGGEAPEYIAKIREQQTEKKQNIKKTTLDSS